MPAPNTTLQVGTYDAATDTFTSVLDLNDQTTYWLQNNGLKVQQPQKVYARGSNIRSPGSRITKWQYGNQHVQASIRLRGATTQALLDAVGSLVETIEQPPYALKIQFNGATEPRYADVVACTHNIPSDPLLIASGAIKDIQIDFECAPGFRGARQWLSNLAMNPGFEAPSGPGVQVFSDAFANTDAYVVINGGSPPTVSGGQMTIPAGTTVQFGSPGWSSINAWAIRFQASPAGVNQTLYLHRPDAFNAIYLQWNDSSMTLYQSVNGTTHSLGSASFTLTSGTWYWLVLTQFPAATGNAPYVQAAMYNDSAGAQGSLITSAFAAAVDVDAGVTGIAAIATGTASLVLSHNTVALFGPGGWTFQSNGAAVASGAWEQNTANTYPSGPVTSFGAARIDAPPTGAFTALWRLYTGGAPAGTSAVPVSQGQVLGLALHLKSSGLGASATITLTAAEYDVNGTQLVSNTVATLTGNQANWTAINTTYTVQNLNTQYVDLSISVADTTSGSANGTLWLDNVQCWNETTTGQSTMPYCELRFPQSPAQMVVSGLLGDMVIPTDLSIGTVATLDYTWYELRFVLGRRARVGAKAQLASPPMTTGAKFALDSTSYGGYYATSTTASKGSITAQPLTDLLGTYHFYGRGQTYDSTPANVAVSSQADLLTKDLGVAWTYNIPNSYPLTHAQAWTALDAGQISAPPSSLQDRTDLTQTYQDHLFSLLDAKDGTDSLNVGWVALIPIDGGYLNMTLFLASTYTNQYFWLYVNGALDRPALNYALTSTAIPNAGQGLGGTGQLASATSNFASATGESVLTLDPTLTCNGQRGVNQLAGIVYRRVGSYSSGMDYSHAILPLYTEIQYSPRYLYPR